MSDHHHHANVESDLHRAFLLDDDGINDIVDFNEQHDTPRWKHDHRDLHHHHGPNSDILIHEHDQFPDHDHIVNLYDDNTGHSHQYGSAVHTHDPADDIKHDHFQADPIDDLPEGLPDVVPDPNVYHDPSVLPSSDIVTDIFGTDEHATVTVHNDDWADGIDNVTGGNPYGH